MSGISRRLFGVMAAAALGCLISGSFVRGDAPTTAPSGTGIITGIVSSNGSPVAGATVRLTAPPKPKSAGTTPAASTNDTPATGAPADPSQPAPGDAPKHGAPKAIQTTTTGADGSFTFTGVAAGDYVVMATLKGTGSGHEKTTVSAGATDTVNITLKARTPKPAN